MRWGLTLGVLINREEENYNARGMCRSLNIGYPRSSSAMRFVMLLLADCAFVLPVERMGGTAKCCPDKRCIFGNSCCDVDLNIDDNMMSCMMPTIKRQDKTPHKETRIASPSFYIVDKCPQDVNDTEDGETPLENVTLADQVPVWSPSKRRIYRSQYISKCHNVSDGQTWSVAISCHLPRANESPEFVLDSIDNLFVASTDKDCDAIFVYRGDINELEPLLCFDYTDYELIGSCSFSDEYLMERYNHSDDRVRCERGSIARFTEFKNIACFRCNIDLKIEVSSLDCPEIPYSVTKSPSDSLLVVLDFQGLRQSQDKKDDNALVCTQAKQGSRKCKRVTCPFGFDSYDGMCVIRNTTQIGRVNEDGETPLENVTLADQVPVWSPSKRRIYRSQYISKCHNVSDGQTWSVAISCHLPRANESPEFVLDSIDNLFVASTDKDCDAIFVYRGDINELEPLLCFDYTDYELIGSCSFSDEYLMERYNHSDDRVRCERGSIARFTEFKNIACFRCNIDLKIEVSSLDCPEIPYSVTKSPSDSLLVVLDFQGLRQSQDKKDDNALVCTQAKQGSRKCKRVTCPFGFDSYDGMCVIRNTTQIVYIAMQSRARKRRLEVAEALRAMDTPDVGPQSGTRKDHAVVAPAPAEPMEDTNVQVHVAMPPRSRKRRREVSDVLRAMATPNVGSRATARSTRQWYLSRRNHCLGLPCSQVARSAWILVGNVWIVGSSIVRVAFTRAEERAGAQILVTKV
ncbi:hypothetical protein DPMN_018411 [Dreissena polymorpha]|uniref:Uncharacterized protein n=1 Tax=Dreissena polymorpha TaxID=45954 RepID=A0A9D4S6C4_DREPO|nr:hypothetical protein DPMN_018411 [Dreissena polymorpha]